MHTYSKSHSETRIAKKVKSFGCLPDQFHEHLESNRRQEGALEKSEYQELELVTWEESIICNTSSQIERI